MITGPVNPPLFAEALFFGKKAVPFVFYNTVLINEKQIQNA
jgi:hypothetical protein